MKEAMEKSDYSESYANASTRIKKTKGYQKTMKPIIERYKKEEERIMKAMEEKDLTNEQYKTLVESADKIRKQIQLIAGEQTENTKLTLEVPPELIEAFNINNETNNETSRSPKEQE